jgi:hypothetical protein
MRISCLVVLLTCTSVAAAPSSLLYAGDISEGNVPFVDDLVMTFSLHAEPSGGAALFEENLPVVVADGFFVVELGLQGGLDFEVLPARTYLQVTIDGSTPRVLLPRQPVGGHARAASADVVATAPDAVTADRVGGLAIGDTVALTELTTPGSIAVPFSAVQGFPAAFADGDQGLVVTAASAPLVFDAGSGALSLSAINATTQLATAAITADKIAANSIPDAAFAADAVTATHLAAGAIVGPADVTDGTLNHTKFASPVAVYRVTSTQCFIEDVGLITLDNDCFVDIQGNANNTLIGYLVP